MWNQLKLKRSSALRTIAQILERPLKKTTGNKNRSIYLVSCNFAGENPKPKIGK
jgi:hypothetical protein